MQHESLLKRVLASMKIMDAKATCRVLAISVEGGLPVTFTIFGCYWELSDKDRAVDLTEMPDIVKLKAHIYLEWAKHKRIADALKKAAERELHELWEDHEEGKNV